MSWFESTPLVCLAPMEDYSDTAFRQMVRKAAAEVIVFTEFISVDGLHHNPTEVRRKHHFEKHEKPIVVQLFGNNPDYFVEAIKHLEELGVDGVDINMGCPAHRIVKCQYGAGLLQNPELAWEIARKVVKETNTPISVKTRLGWEDKEQILEFAKGFEDAGISVITLHGRTYKQGFSGEADWEPMYRLKEKIKHMKVIGNGDIHSGQEALDKIGNLDGVMVGRMSFGNPWALKEVYDSLKNGKHTPCEPSFEERIPWILEHCKLTIKYKGEKKAMLEMRKQLGAYVKGIEGAKEMRGRLVRVESLEEVEEILHSIS